MSPASIQSAAGALVNGRVIVCGGAGSGETIGFATFDACNALPLVSPTSMGAESCGPVAVDPNGSDGSECDGTPVGRNCTRQFCNTGYLLRGGLYQCEATSTGAVWSGSQLCVPVGSVFTVSNTMASTRQGAAVAHCAWTSPTLFVVGGTIGGTAQLGSYKTTLSATWGTWLTGPTLPLARAYAVGLCDAVNLYVLFGSGFATFAYSTGSTFSVNSSPGPTARGKGDAVFIPSSSPTSAGVRQDILHGPGESSTAGTPTVADFWRLSMLSMTWTCVCTGAPWPSRWGYKLAYVGSRLIMTGGTDGTSVMSDAWVSDTDGMTWAQLSAGGQTWGARHGHTMFSVGGILTIMFGRTSVSGAGVVNDVYQSVTRGDTWQLVASGSINTAARAYAGSTVGRGMMIVCGGGDVTNSNQNTCSKIAFAGLGDLAFTQRFPFTLTQPPQVQGGLKRDYVLARREMRTNSVVLTPTFSSFISTFTVSLNGVTTSLTSGASYALSLSVGDVMTFSGDSILYRVTVVADVGSPPATPPRPPCGIMVAGTSDECTTQCSTGQQQFGGPRVAARILPATLAGVSQCSMPTAWTTLATAGVGRSAAVMVYCPSSELLYWGLGWGGALLTDFYASRDGGVSWFPSISRAQGRIHGNSVCDADGTIHVAYGEDSDTSGGAPTVIRLKDGASAWEDPITVPGVSTTPTRNPAMALVPSSADRDYLLCGGFGLQSCRRWISSTSSFVTVCDSLAWLARDEAEMRYVGNTVVLVGGLVSGVAQNDVWVSTSQLQSRSHCCDALSRLHRSLTLCVHCGGVTVLALFCFSSLQMMAPHGATSSAAPVLSTRTGVRARRTHCGVTPSRSSWHSEWGTPLRHSETTCQNTHKSSSEGHRRIVLTLASALCCCVVCSWQSVDEGRTWNQVVADGAVLPSDVGGRVQSGHVTVNGRHVVCGGARTGSVDLATCYSLQAGLIQSLTFSGVTLSPPLQTGKRFDYTGVIEVPTASFRLELRLGGSYSYVLHEAAPVSVNSGDKVTLAGFLYGQSASANGQRLRRSNVMQLWTGEGIYRFTLTAAPGAGIPKPPTAKLQALWANPDGQTGTVMVRGMTSLGGFTDWTRTQSPLGGAFPLRWADSPMVNRIEVMASPATTKYTIAVTTTGGCATGTSSTGPPTPHSEAHSLTRPVHNVARDVVSHWLLLVRPV